MKEQLQSISCQTYQVGEIVISDDASSDNTRSIIKDFYEENKHRHKIIMNFNNVNQGYGRNFSIALSLSSGDLLFFSDQDDVWHPSKVEVVVGLFDLYPHIIGATHDGLLVDELRASTGLTKNSQIRSAYGQAEVVITGALSAMRGAVARELLPFPPGVGHDICLERLRRISPKMWCFHDACLSEIRRHRANTSEWLVNSSFRVKSYHRVIKQLTESAATSYDDRLEINRWLERVLNRSIIIDSIAKLGVPLEDCISRVRVEKLAIMMRNRLLTRKFWISRLVLGLRMLASGQYRHFNGLYSFLRDVLR